MDWEYVIIFAVLAVAAGAQTIRQRKLGKKWKLGAAVTVGFVGTLIIYFLGHHNGRM